MAVNIVQKLVPEDHPWLASPPLVRLMEILNREGINARLVGGCVRDALMGLVIRDIDIACRLTPEVALKRLEAAGVKVIATGLKHGTITAVLEGQNFEITTLRRDMETYGRHAKVAFTDDWHEDAKRRDFTFNALYLDLDGSLYDPCGGLADSSARRVRFIGDAGLRIREDSLRILRFFRFAACVGRGEMDADGLQSCKSHKSLIDHLSGERVAQEIFKILQAEFVLPVMAIMAQTGILAHILPGHAALEKFSNFVKQEQKRDHCDILMRLSCLLPGDKAAGARLSHHLRLSKAQSKMLVLFSQITPAKPDLTERDMRKIIYQQGREAALFALYQGGHLENISYAESWIIPEFPLKGRDLSLPAGPEMGRVLTRLEEKWVESDFNLSREKLLEKVPSGASLPPEPSPQRGPH